MLYEKRIRVMKLAAGDTAEGLKSQWTPGKDNSQIPVEPVQGRTPGAAGKAPAKPPAAGRAPGTPPAGAASATARQQGLSSITREEGLRSLSGGKGYNATRPLVPPAPPITIPQPAAPAQPLINSLK